jgi:Cell Wall Hydrolase
MSKRKCLRIWRLEALLHLVAPKFSLACAALLGIAFVSYTTVIKARTERATMCLAENVYHEARGEPSGAKYTLAMLTLARVADPDPQWPKTICGAVAQDLQFSWTLDYKLATDRSEQKLWEEAQFIARDVIANAWTRYALPKGWECARYYKRTDGKGVSKHSMQYFDARLFPVGTFGSHTAFQERAGCRMKLPTV